MLSDIPWPEHGAGGKLLTFPSPFHWDDKRVIEGEDRPEIRVDLPSRIGGIGDTVALPRDAFDAVSYLAWHGNAACRSVVLESSREYTVETPVIDDDGRVSYRRGAMPGDEVARLYDMFFHTWHEDPDFYESD